MIYIYIKNLAWIAFVFFRHNLASAPWAKIYCTVFPIHPLLAKTKIYALFS